MFKRKEPRDRDVKLYSERVANDPDTLAFLPLAKLYRNNGMVEQAIQMCVQGLEKHPGNVEARLLLADCLVEAGKTAEAEREIGKALEAVPTSEKAQDALKKLRDKDAQSGQPAQPRGSATPVRPAPRAPAPVQKQDVPDDLDEMLDFEKLLGDEEPAPKSQGSGLSKADARVEDDDVLGALNWDLEDETAPVGRVSAPPKPRPLDKREPRKPLMEEDASSVDLDDLMGSSLSEKSLGEAEEDLSSPLDFLSDLEADVSDIVPSERQEDRSGSASKGPKILRTQYSKEKDETGDSMPRILRSGASEELTGSGRKVPGSAGMPGQIGDSLESLRSGLSEVLGKDRKKPEPARPVSRPVEEEDSLESLRSGLSDVLGKDRKKPEPVRPVSRSERGNLGRRAVEEFEDLDGLMDEVSDSSLRGFDDEGEDVGILEMLPQEDELQGEDVLDAKFSGEEAEPEIPHEAFEEEPEARPSRPSSGPAKAVPAQAPEPEDELERILNELNKPDDISGSMAVGSEGFVIASVFKEKTELERMAAVLASIIETACRSTQRMKLGVFQGVLVETEMGIIDLVNGQGMSLVVFMKEDARLGLVRMRMQKALKALNEYLA